MLPISMYKGHTLLEELDSELLHLGTVQIRGKSAEQLQVHFPGRDASMA